MKRTFLASLVLWLALAGCVEMPAGTTVEPAAAPAGRLTPQAFLPLVGPGGTPTQTHVFLPVVGETSGECKTHTAAMTLSATAVTLQVGQVVTLTATLANPGCVALGLPQYRLSIQSGGAPSLFDPADPQPVVHNLAVAPGQSDAATFVLRAIRSGQATLDAAASFEVHLGYPGPAYWGSAATSPLTLTVTP